MESTGGLARKRRVGRALLLGYSCVAVFALITAGIPTDMSQVGILAFLFVLSALASRIVIETKHMAFSAEIIPILLACVLFPSSGLFVALSNSLSEYKSWNARMINTLSLVIAARVAGEVSVVVGHTMSLTSIFTNTFVCGLAFLLVNVALIAFAGTMIGVYTLRNYAKVALANVVATSLFNFPVIAAVIWGFTSAGFWILPMVLIPLTLVQYFHGLYHKKAVLTDDLAEKAVELAKTNIQFASAMVRALDARDAYTAGHSAAVAVYCRDIAREVGFDEKGSRLAHLAGLLHDIGKIGVPGSVLNKKEKLTDEEFELMKEHARIGAEILAEVDSYSEISMLVRHHHERIDGRGYPDKIAGDVIPEISRMISVADTYSAMTTDRPYRKGLDPKIAVDEMIKGAGTQLDTTYVECFVRILRRESDEYRRGKLTSFDVEVAKHETMGEFETHVIEKADEGIGREKAA